MATSLGSGVFFEDSSLGSGSGNYDAFVRLQDRLTEEGFNTDEDHLADNVNGVFTHSLKVGDLVKVLIDGVYYYEFRLDLNEGNSGSAPNITLDELQFFRSAAPAGAANYDATNGVMIGLGGAVFDLGGPVALTDIRSGSGTDDYRFLIPAALFPDANEYLTLFSRFTGSDGGFEEWRALTNTTVQEPAPAITVVKDADPVTIDEGGASVVYHYTLTSQSASTDPLALDTLVDNNGTAGTGDDVNLLTGFVSGSNYGSYYTGGDTDGDYLLDSTESWTFSYTHNNLALNAGQTWTNVVSVTAHDDENTSVSDTDDATVTATDLDPSINIVKTSATTKIDEGKIVAVTFTYALTNTSAAGAFDPLTITSLVDDNGTVGTGDDFTLTYVNGDTDSDGKIDAGETWNYTATVNVGPFNAGATHTNVVTVKAVDDEGTEATDSDDHTITAVDTDPAINIVKTSATTQINEGKVVAVTFTYALTNTSAAGAFDPLTITSLVDDNGTVGTGDDFTLTYVDGDTDTDGLLDAGETWNYTAVANVGALNAGQTHTNVVTVKATDDEGNEATDSDDHTITAKDTDPTVNVVKSSSTTEIDEGKVVAVTFTYAVTNTSAAGAFDPLTVVSLVDDNGTIGAGDDFTPSYVGGDTNSNGLLDYGETWNYSAVVNVGALNAGGTHTNIVTVTAKDDEGNSTSDNDDHTITAVDTDPSINIVKTSTTTQIDEGSVAAVTFTYALTNTSAAGAFDPLTITSLIDDNGTASTADDFGLTYVSGDDGDGLLEFGETWNYTATTNVGPLNGGEAHTNVVTVIAEDDEGSEATDTDDHTITGKDLLPGVNIDKVASVAAVTAGVSTPVTFTYTITNLSQTATDPLKLLTLVDDMGTASTADDVNLLTAGTFSGDTDNDGLLDLNETWVVTYTANLTLARGETRTNVVTVTAEDDEHNPVNDSDDASVVGAWGLTPGFWSNNGSKIWDGNGSTFPNNGSWIGLVAAGQDLAYGIHDLNGDGDTADSGELAQDTNPTTGNRGYLMIGDWDKDGFADANENVLVVSRGDALTFLNASLKDQQDGRFQLARDLVASWLNYLAGSPVGTSNDPNSAMHYMDEAIGWLIQTTTDHNHVLTTADMGTAKVAQSSSAWNSGFSFDGDSILGENQTPTAGNHDIGYDYGTSTNTGLDIMAGNLIHTGLDHFNNTGLVL